jgi:iron complex transport system ATP-binding protein
VEWSADDRLIVQGVSIEARPGSLVGLLGPNGSGKTSLLRLLASTLTPSAGTVALGSVDPSRVDRRQIARLLAALTQEATTEFQPTVADVVMLGRIPHQSGIRGTTPEDRAIVADALARVNLDELAGRSYPTLSGGEKQRAQLARTMAQETPILLLDEPSNHLDVAHQYGLLHAVRALGATTIAALHDLNLAAACCDQIVVLLDGRVEASGPPLEVLTAEFVQRVWKVPCEVTASSQGRPYVIFFPDLG